MHTLLLLAITLDIGTAGKILGELSAVYAVLQALKKAFPQLEGRWMVVLNIALSLVGAAVIIPPSSLLSSQSLVVVLLAGIQAAGAAGIHGTVQNVAPVALQKALGQSQTPATETVTANKSKYDID